MADNIYRGDKLPTWYGAMETSMTTHSRFAPSKMARIVACPGSVQLCEQVPKKPSSSYAEEGTMMHSFMAKCDDLGPEVFNTGALTAEQRNACLDAWDYVQLVKASCPKSGQITYAEAQVKLDGCPEVYGTADYLILAGGHLHVIDYKFGAFTWVNAVDNWQLISYGLGAISHLPMDAVVEDVTLHIVQPRMANFQSETYTVEQMLEFETKIIRAVATACGPEPTYRPGEAQCKWCDAAAVCPTRHTMAVKAAQQVFALHADIEHSNIVTDEEIAQFYADLPVLEASIKAVKQHVLAELLRKRKVAGFKLVRTKASRAWKDQAATTSFLIDRLDDFGLSEDDIITSKLVSPAQVEKLMRGIKKNEEFQALITQGPGSITVVSEDDARPEATGDAADAFAGHEDDEE